MAPPFYVYDLLASETSARWGADSPVGTPVTITYGFPASEPGSVPYPNFTPFTQTEITATQNALAYISSLTGITFVKTTSASAQLQFGNGDLTSLGSGVGGRTDYTYNSDGIQQATVILSNTGQSSLANSDFVPGSITSNDIGGKGWGTLLHELGHALGLKHPFEENIAGDPNSILPSNLDDLSRTVMSYTAYQPSNVAIVTGTSSSYSYTYSNLDPQTYSLYDIAALQYLYGANTSSAGNKVFSFSPNSPVLETVYDAGPNDTIDCSALTGACTIDMNPGAMSNLAISQSLPFGITLNDQYNGTSAFTIAYGCLIANCVGGSGSDTITGNAGANVIDGGAGADAMTGGGGGDTFLFDTALGAGNVDSIADFTPSTLASPDKIALSQAIFTTLKVGLLTAGAFEDITATSETASARILYNHSTGGLFYDPDGNASTNAAVQLATLTSEPTLTAADFKVIADHASDDFNGDGRSDIFFRNDDNGAIGYATINGNGTSTTYHPLGTSGTAYAVAGIGDVNGDGLADVLFRASNGALGYDTVNGNNTSTTYHPIGTSSTAYAVAGVGDFNGDGKADILFRNNNSGALGYDTVNSDGTSVTFHAIGPSSTAYAAVGVGDFNGDGKSDILFRNNSNGAIGYDTINSNGTSVTFHAIGPSGTAYSVAGVGDFNGDGLADILFRNANGALGYDTINGNGTSTTFHAIGASGTAYAVVGTGDYTGDGVSDILFRNNSSGALGFDTINGNGTSTTFHAIGTSGTAYTVHS